MKVLVVEDDPGLAKRLLQSLSQHHYQVEVAADAKAGLRSVEASNYDLVLLDLLLPQLNGIDFCRHLRAQGNDVPILMMTAEAALDSKVMGLDAGADDYLVKPLDFDELLARMRALLRRSKAERAPLLAWGEVRLDPGSYDVFACGQWLPVTSKEYEILALLMRNPHRVFSVDALIERLWPLEKLPSENAVRTHIESMRHKLKQAGVAVMIETVYGLGYRLCPTSSSQLLSGSSSSVVSGSVSAPSLPSSSEPFPPAVSVADSPSSQTAQTAQTAPDIVSTSFSERLRDIWERHQPKYLALIEGLSEAIPVLRAQKASSTADLVANQLVLTRSQADIHTLKGALGSLGFTQASEISAQIEALLRSQLPLSSAKINQLSALVENLKQSLPSPVETASSETPSVDSATLKPSAIASAQNVRPKLRTQPLGYRSDPVIYQWLIIDSDMQVTERLLRKASLAGIACQVAHTPEEAERLLAWHIPAVVTFDPCCAANWEEGVAFLANLIRQHPSLPVVVASDQGTLNARINVVRSGGCTFLQKPVSSARMLETVNHLIAKPQSTDARIIALDDDPQILECLKYLLAPWGFQLTLLSDPLRFWSALEQSFPDLLILDIEMPSFNGLDLCRVIRSDPKTAQVPILFLSAHTDPDIVRQVFEAGADDYVSKPIVGPELISRILNRLERLRFFRKLAETDSLTDLSCRRHSLDALNRLLKLSVRQNASLCLALLDLDYFKQVNDRYGHDLGDQVLRTLGSYLRKSFRGEDVVARWGGEEFVVGLYDVSEAMAIKRLNALRETFGQHLFQTGSGSSFQVSLSGGVAISPADGATIQTLYRHADKALYRAKAAGRNQICAFGSQL